MFFQQQWPVVLLAWQQRHPILFRLRASLFKSNIKQHLLLYIWIMKMSTAEQRAQGTSIKEQLLSFQAKANCELFTKICSRVDYITFQVVILWRMAINFALSEAWVLCPLVWLCCPMEAHCIWKQSCTARMAHTALKGQARAKMLKAVQLKSQCPRREFSMQQKWNI